MVEAMSTGARIKARREALQLTQQGLAERINAIRGLAPATSRGKKRSPRTHQADVSNWEHDRAVPPTRMLAAVASALDKSIDWLLTGREAGAAQAPEAAA